MQRSFFNCNNSNFEFPCMTKCCHGYCRCRCIENQTTAVHEPELQLKSKKRPIEKRHELYKRTRNVWGVCSRSLSVSLLISVCIFVGSWRKNVNYKLNHVKKQNKTKNWRTNKNYTCIRILWHNSNYMYVTGVWSLIKK